MFWSLIPLVIGCVVVAGMLGVAYLVGMSGLLYLDQRFRREQYHVDLATSAQQPPGA